MSHGLFPGSKPPATESVVLAGVYWVFWHTNVLLEANRALLFWELALRAYHEEHGQYPDSSADFPEEVRRLLPTDPYTHSEPIKYLKEGDSYLLYSVGPDGVDDGGKPPVDSDYGLEWRIQPESKGDIVPGIRYSPPGGWRE